MAIAFDSTVAGSTASATSLTISQTLASSDNRLLLVATSNGANVSSGTVTYAGTAMTNLFTMTSGFDVWYMLNPATGANNIISQTASSQALTLIGISYTSVRQTGFPDAGSAGTTTPAATGTLGLTVSADQSWVAAFLQSTTALIPNISDNTGRGSAGTAGGVYTPESAGDTNAGQSAGITKFSFSNGSVNSYLVSFAPLTSGYIGKYYS